jgi:serine/threonine protein kinase
VYEGTVHRDGVGSVPCALKVLHGGALPDAEIRGLLREVRAALAAASACAFVCPVLGATVWERSPALVLPLYEGSADDLVNEEHADGLPLALALRIGQAVLRALAAMHMRGIVHRDLKPQNVLINAGGREVGVSDFGLSQSSLQATISAGTARGDGCGTLPYMVRRGAAPSRQPSPRCCTALRVSTWRAHVRMCAGLSPPRHPSSPTIRSQLSPSLTPSASTLALPRRRPSNTAAASSASARRARTSGPGAAPCSTS